MRIVINDMDRLVIEDRPWFLWLTVGPMSAAAIYAVLTGGFAGWGETLLVAALGAGGVWMVHHFAPFQRFVFDRTAATFTHSVHRITGPKSWALALSDIRRAADEGQHSDGARLERVTLLTRTGRHPMESGFSSRRTKPMVEAINAWLEREP